MKKIEDESKHESYYYNNKKYIKILDNLDKSGYSKYVHFIKKLMLNKKEFLDVGCGSGLVLKSLEGEAFKSSGIDVSKAFIEVCQKRQLNAIFYDGKTFPFKNDSFDCVGSYNVLEHVDDPTNYLEENFRVLKKNGYLIIACPNFLSISNNYHHHTRGYIRKFKNLFMFISMLLQVKSRFYKMAPINRKVFQTDDDAINITNPFTIKKWAKSKKMKEIYWSSQSVFRKGALDNLDNGIIKYFLGSSFFVFKKK